MLKTIKRNTIMIHNSDIKLILFRNLAGAPDRWSEHPTPSFVVVLSDELGRDLEEQGLNIKWKPNRDNDLVPQLQVFARFDKFPPNIFQRVEGSPTLTLLGEDDVHILDNADIVGLDMEINPSRYDTGTRQGIKAYIVEATFTIMPNQFSKSE